MELTQTLNFNIPKLNRQATKDNLFEVDPNSRDGKELLSNVTRSYLDQNYSGSWKIKAIHMVRNTELEQEYRNKRNDMKEEGRHSRELIDQISFCIIKDPSNVPKIAKNGLTTKNLPFSIIGDYKSGVYLSKHADVQLRMVETISHQLTTAVFVFNVLMGKCKAVNERLMSTIEPTPNYDCHVGLQPAQPSDTHVVQMQRSQIYLYEYDDDGMPANHPRHCLPYAVITYERSQNSVYAGCTPKSIYYYDPLKNSGQGKKSEEKSDWKKGPRISGLFQQSFPGVKNASVSESYSRNPLVIQSLMGQVIQNRDTFSPDTVLDHDIGPNEQCGMILPNSLSGYGPQIVGADGSKRVVQRSGSDPRMKYCHQMGVWEAEGQLGAESQSGLSSHQSADFQRIYEGQYGQKYYTEEPNMDYKDGRELNTVFYNDYESPEHLSWYKPPYNRPVMMNEVDPQCPSEHHSWKDMNKNMGIYPYGNNNAKNRSMGSVYHGSGSEYFENKDWRNSYCDSKSANNLYTTTASTSNTANNNNNNNNGGGGSSNTTTTTTTTKKSIPFALNKKKPPAESNSEKKSATESSTKKESKDSSLSQSHSQQKSLTKLQDKLSTINKDILQTESDSQKKSATKSQKKSPTSVTKKSSNLADSESHKKSLSKVSDNSSANKLLSENDPSVSEVDSPLPNSQTKVQNNYIHNLMMQLFWSLELDNFDSHEKPLNSKLKNKKFGQPTKAFSVNKLDLGDLKKLKEYIKRKVSLPEENVKNTLKETPKNIPFKVNPKIKKTSAKQSLKTTILLPTAAEYSEEAVPQTEDLNKLLSIVESNIDEKERLVSSSSSTTTTTNNNKEGSPTLEFDNAYKSFLECLQKKQIKKTQCRKLSERKENIPYDKIPPPTTNVVSINDVANTKLMKELLLLDPDYSESTSVSEADSLYLPPSERKKTKCSLTPRRQLKKKAPFDMSGYRRRRKRQKMKRKAAEFDNNSLASTTSSFGEKMVFSESNSTLLNYNKQFDFDWVYLTNPSFKDSLAPSSQDNLASSSQDSLAPSSQDSWAPSSQDSLTPSSHDSLAPSPHDSLAPSSHDSLAPSSQDNFAPSSQDNFAPSSQDNFAPSSQDNLVPFSQDNLVPFSQDNLVPFSQDNLVPFSQDNLIPFSQDNLAPSSQDNLAPSSQDNLAPSSQDNLAPSSQDNLAPSSQDNLASSSQDNLASSSQDNLAPSSQDNLAPSSQDNLAPSSQDNLAPSSQDNLAPSSQDNLAPSSQDNLAPSSQDNLASVREENPTKVPTLKELGYTDWRSAVFSVEFQPFVVLTDFVQQITSHLQLEGTSSVTEWIGRNQDLMNALNFPEQQIKSAGISTGSIPQVVTETTTTKTINQSSSKATTKTTPLLISQTSTKATTKTSVKTASKTSAKTTSQVAGLSTNTTTSKEISKSKVVSPSDKASKPNKTSSDNSLKKKIKVAKDKFSCKNPIKEKKQYLEKTTSPKISKLNKEKKTSSSSYVTAKKPSTTISPSSSFSSSSSSSTSPFSLLSSPLSSLSTQMKSSKTIVPKGIMKASRPEPPAKTIIILPGTFPPTDQSLKVDLLLDSIIDPPLPPPPTVEQKKPKSVISFKAYKEKRLKPKSPPREKTNVFESLKDFLPLDNDSDVWMKSDTVSHSLSDKQKIEKNLLNFPSDNNPCLYSALSPTNFRDPRLPPMLVSSGPKDIALPMVLPPMPMVTPPMPTPPMPMVAPPMPMVAPPMPMVAPPMPMVAPPMPMVAPPMPMVAPPMPMVAPPMPMVAPPMPMVAPPMPMVAPPMPMVAPPMPMVAPPMTMVAPPMTMVAPPMPMVAPPMPMVASPMPMVAPPMPMVAPPMPMVAPPMPMVAPPMPMVAPPMPMVAPPMPMVAPPMPMVAPPMPKVIPPNPKMISSTQIIPPSIKPLLPAREEPKVVPKNKLLSIKQPSILSKKISSLPKTIPTSVRIPLKNPREPVNLVDPRLAKKPLGAPKCPTTPQDLHSLKEPSSNSPILLNDSSVPRDPRLSRMNRDLPNIPLSSESQVSLPSSSNLEKPSLLQEPQADLYSPIKINDNIVEDVSVLIGKDIKSSVAVSKLTGSNTVKKDTWNLCPIYKTFEPKQLMALPIHQDLSSAMHKFSRSQETESPKDCIPDYAKFSKEFIKGFKPSPNAVVIKEEKTFSPVSPERSEEPVKTKSVQPTESNVDNNTWGFYREMLPRKSISEETNLISDDEFKLLMLKQKSNFNLKEDSDTDSIMREFSPTGSFSGNSNDSDTIDEDLTKPLYIDESASRTPRSDTIDRFMSPVKDVRAVRVPEEDDDDDDYSFDTMDWKLYAKKELTDISFPANGKSCNKQNMRDSVNIENRSINRLQLLDSDLENAFQETSMDRSSSFDQVSSANTSTSTALFSAYDLEGRGGSVKDTSHIWMKSLSTLSQAKAVSSLNISDEMMDIFRKVVKENIPGNKDSKPSELFHSKIPSNYKEKSKKQFINENESMGLLDLSTLDTYSRNPVDNGCKPNRLLAKKKEGNSVNSIDVSNPTNSSDEAVIEMYSPTHPTCDDTSSIFNNEEDKKKDDFVPGRAIPVLKPAKKQGSFQKPSKRARSQSPTPLSALKLYPPPGWIPTPPSFWPAPNPNWPISPFTSAITNSLHSQLLWSHSVNMPPSLPGNPMPFPVGYPTPDLCTANPVYFKSLPDSLAAPKHSNLVDWFADKFTPKGEPSAGNTRLDKDSHTTLVANFLDTLSATKPTEGNSELDSSFSQVQPHISKQISSVFSDKEIKNTKIHKSNSYTELQSLTKDQEKYKSELSRSSCYSPTDKTSDLSSLSFLDHSQSSESSKDCIIGNTEHFKIQRTISNELSISSFLLETSKMDSQLLKKKDSSGFKQSKLTSMNPLLSMSTYIRGNDNGRDKFDETDANVGLSSQNLQEGDSDLDTLGLTKNNILSMISSGNCSPSEAMLSELISTHQNDSITQNSTSSDDFNSQVSEFLSCVNSKKKRTGGERRKSVGVSKSKQSKRDKKDGHIPKSVQISTINSRKLKETSLPESNRKILRELAKQFSKNKRKSDFQALLESVKKIKKELASQPPETEEELPAGITSVVAEKTQRVVWINKKEQLQVTGKSDSKRLFSGDRSFSCSRSKRSKSSEKSSENLWKPVQSLAEEKSGNSDSTTVVLDYKQKTPEPNTTSDKNSEDRKCTPKQLSDRNEGSEKAAQNSESELEEGELPDEDDDESDDDIEKESQKYNSIRRSNSLNENKGKWWHDERHDCSDSRLNDHNVHMPSRSKIKGSMHNKAEGRRLSRMNSYPAGPSEGYQHDSYPSRVEDHPHGRIDDYPFTTSEGYMLDQMDNYPSDHSDSYSYDGLNDDTHNRIDSYPRGRGKNYARGNLSDYHEKCGYYSGEKFVPYPRSKTSCFIPEDAEDYPKDSKNYYSDEHKSYSRGKSDDCLPGKYPYNKANRYSYKFESSQNSDDYFHEKADGYLYAKSNDYFFDKGFSYNRPYSSRVGYSTGKGDDFSYDKECYSNDEDSCSSAKASQLPGKLSTENEGKLSNFFKHGENWLNRPPTKDSRGEIAASGRAYKGRRSASSDNLSADDPSRVEEGLNTSKKKKNIKLRIDELSYEELLEETAKQLNEQPEEEEKKCNSFETIDEYVLMFVDPSCPEYKIMKKLLGIPLDTRFDSMSKTRRKKIRKKIQSQLQALKQAPAINGNEAGEPCSETSSSTSALTAMDLENLPGCSAKMGSDSMDFIKSMKMWLNQQPEDDRAHHSRSSSETRDDSEDEGNCVNNISDDWNEDINIADPEIKHAVRKVRSDMCLWMEKSSGYGTPHQRVPLSLLLAEEKDSLFSCEGCFLILMQKIPRKSVERLVILREVLDHMNCEMQLAQQTNDASKFQTLQSTKINLHDRRKCVLDTFTGTLNTKRLQLIEEAQNTYQCCLDYLNANPDSIKKLDKEFVAKTLKAIQGHISTVKKILEKKDSKGVPSMSSIGCPPNNQVPIGMATTVDSLPLSSQLMARATSPCPPPTPTASLSTAIPATGIPINPILSGAGQSLAWNSTLQPSTFSQSPATSPGTVLSTNIPPTTSIAAFYGGNSMFWNQTG